jgi:hypothetical protein
VELEQKPKVAPVPERILDPTGPPEAPEEPADDPLAPEQPGAPGGAAPDAPSPHEID